MSVTPQLRDLRASPLPCQHVEESQEERLGERQRKDVYKSLPPGKKYFKVKLSKNKSKIILCLIFFIPEVLNRTQQPFENRVLVGLEGECGRKIQIRTM